MSDKFVIPTNIPPLEDPCFGGPSPYAGSALRDVLGTRINPDSVEYYRNPSVITQPSVWVKTAAHPELQAWLSEVDGFDSRARIYQPPLEDWPFSACIPRLVVWGEELKYPLDAATYMIDYRYLHSNPQTLPQREWLPTLKKRFPSGTRLLLSFFGDRSLLLGLWTLMKFWEAEFLDQFDGIVLPDFSAYSNDPKAQILFGERMQQIFGSEGAAAGRTIVPSIAWCDEPSLRRQIELWTSQQPDINTIMLDCYGSGVDRTLWIWRWLYAMEKYCAPHTNIRWLVAGFTSGWAIRELNRIFPNGNYCLVPSVSTYLGAMRGTTDPDVMALNFRKSIMKLEDFKSGEMVADAMPRPDHWPQFSEMLKTK